MRTTVQKWGNSLAVRLPKRIAEDTEVSEGISMEIRTENGKIILSPVKKEQTLEQLIELITPENLHTEFSTGKRVGGELW